MKTCHSIAKRQHSRCSASLYPSPRASKLGVWCGALGKRVITSVKHTAQGETRLSALEAVVNDESRRSDTVREGLPPAHTLAHRHPLENTRLPFELHQWPYKHLFMPGWLVTQEEPEAPWQITHRRWNEAEWGHDVTSLWEREETADGQWRLEIQYAPLLDPLDHFTSVNRRCTGGCLPVYVHLTKAKCIIVHVFQILKASFSVNFLLWLRRNNDFITILIAHPFQNPSFMLPPFHSTNFFWNFFSNQVLKSLEAIGNPKIITQLPSFHPYANGKSNTSSGL